MINISKWVFLGIAVVLIVSAAVLILNTIRMAIFARRREVSVMKLVGATNWFIRVPFMSEGSDPGLPRLGVGRRRGLRPVSRHQPRRRWHRHQQRLQRHAHDRLGGGRDQHRRGVRRRADRLARLGHRHPAFSRRVGASDSLTVWASPGGSDVPLTKRRGCSHSGLGHRECDPVRRSGRHVIQAQTRLSGGRAFSSLEHGEGHQVDQHEGEQ